MVVKIRFLVLLVTTLIFGIAWAAVYLLFSTFHGMTKMFNGKFIFFLARILDIHPYTIKTGFTFAFFDGALLGFLIGIILLKIYKRNRV